MEKAKLSVTLKKEIKVAQMGHANVGTLKIRTSKGQNIESFLRAIRPLKVKKITTSKDHNIERS
jgi:hypothetical protein